MQQTAQSAVQVGWPPVLILVFVLAAFMWFVYHDQNNRLQNIKEKRKPTGVCVGIIIAFAIIRMYVAPFFKGYPIDMNTYTAWMDRAAGGLNGFYADGYFCDYPPLYIAMTGFFGWLKNLLNPILEPVLTPMLESTFQTVQKLLNDPELSPMMRSVLQSLQIPLTGGEYLSSFFVKLPAIIAEALISYEILRMYCKRYPVQKQLPVAVLLSLLPSFLITSTVWGQTDGIFCYLMLLTFRFMMEDKLTLCATFFTLSALMKPQSFLFAPIVAIFFIKSDSMIFLTRRKIVKTGNHKNNQAITEEQIIVPAVSKAVKIIWNLVVTFVFSLAIMSISMIPFRGGKPDLLFLISKYQETFSSYPYASLNTFNLFGLLNGNMKNLTDPFMFLTFEKWGTILMAACVLAGIVAVIFNKNKKNLFLIFATYLFAIVMLGSKMHERYWYFVPVLLLLSFVVTGKKKYFGISCLLSLLYFLNLDYALWYLGGVRNELTENYQNMIFVIASITNLATLWYLVWEVFTVIRADYPQREKKVWEYSQKFTWKSAVSVLCVMVIFAGAAFYRLGSTDNTPQTYAKVARGQSVTFRFDDNVELAEIRYFAGYGLRNFKLRQDSPESSQYVNFSGKEEKSTYVFSWQQEKLANPVVNQVVLEVLENGSDEITEWGEFAFYNTAGEMIPYTVLAPDGVDTAAFSDEPKTIPEVPSYENSFYFDEIYHGRAAYEYKNDISMYETTHPPLGKLIITIGISLFGMNPFGCRFMGVVFAILMIPVFYLLAKRLFRYNIVALLTTILFSFGFMHLSHTRISSIDSFMVFFIIAAFAFLLEFVHEYVEKGITWKTLLFLGISGAMFGCGAAVKWAAIYPGIGLGAIYLYAIWLRYQKTPQNTQAGKLILYSLGLYAVLPFAIYYLTYIPYFGTFNQELTWKSFTSAQQHMFNYHSQLTATHPFSASWYDWMADLRPLWMHQGVLLADGSRETIVTMGNPILLWGGLAGIIYMLIDSVKQKKVTLPAFVILAGYLSQMLPWMFVTRCTFMYHYFPMVAFLALGVGYYWSNNVAKKGKAMWAPIGVCALAIVFFAVFYPALTGIPAAPEYISKLKIMPRWDF
ncbi:MAG: phospholipid carrier-dependent glycosyltransferase [Ruminococcaceae bacterium]|nr:phospholipid carrier-dependent glycosyltransferase [Oscillospiraceae bacterium]